MLGVVSQYLPTPTSQLIEQSDKKFRFRKIANNSTHLKLGKLMPRHKNETIVSNRLFILATDLGLIDDKDLIDNKGGLNDAEII